MKIAIMGAGGIGGFYGGLLARAGEDVIFIARGPHLDAMRNNGLRVLSHFGDFDLPTVNATDDPAQVGPVELVVMTTKAYGLEAAARAIQPMVDAETLVLPLLNGVDIAERIGAVIAAEHVLGGLAKISSAIAEPGVIRQTSPFQQVLFGEFSGEPSPRVRAVEAVLKGAQIDAVLTPHIERELWNKFLFLAATAGMCALTRQPVGPVRSDPDTRELLESSMREIEAVARRKGVDLDEGIVAAALQGLPPPPPDMRPSMLLDLERGKPLELDALNGTVVRLGAELGVPTPVNRFIYAALKLHADGQS